MPKKLPSNDKPQKRQIPCWKKQHQHHNQHQNPTCAGRAGDQSLARPAYVVCFGAGFGAGLCCLFFSRVMFVLTNKSIHVRCQPLLHFVKLCRTQVQTSHRRQDWVILLNFDRKRRLVLKQFLIFEHTCGSLLAPDSSCINRRMSGKVICSECFVLKK